MPLAWDKGAVRSMAPGATAVIDVVVKASDSAKVGTQRTWLVTCASSTDPSQKDVVGVMAEAK